MMNDQKPRIGVLMPHRLPARDVVPFAVAVENAGAQDLWIPENFGYVGGYSAAAAVLASTEKIRVGTGISAIPLRHPFANAMEIGTLANMFPGRYVAGLGMGVRGWIETLARWPTSPIRETKEALRAVSDLLGGETVSASSELFEMSGVSLDTGVQGDFLAMHIGAVGPAMLRLAAQSADGVILSVLSSPEYVRWALQQINEANERTASPETVCFANLSISDAGMPAATELLRDDTAFLLAAMGESPLTNPLKIREELKTLLMRVNGNALDLARELPDQWIEQLSIAGTVDQCASRMHDYITAGVDTLVLAPKPSTEAYRLVVDRLPHLLPSG